VRSSKAEVERSNWRPDPRLLLAGALTWRIHCGAAMLSTGRPQQKRWALDGEAGMRRRVYSRRERVLFACFVPILGALAAFMVYGALTVADLRHDALYWFSFLGNLGAVAICLKIAITGTATRRLEQNAFDALAGRPLDDERKPPSGPPAA
jgi:hypothetical protein